MSSKVSPLLVDDADALMLIASALSRFAAISNDVRAVEPVLEAVAQPHALARQLAADELDPSRHQRVGRDEPHAGTELR